MFGGKLNDAGTRCVLRPIAAFGKEIRKGKWKGLGREMEGK